MGTLATIGLMLVEHPIHALLGVETLFHVVTSWAAEYHSRVRFYVPCVVVRPAT